MSYFYATITPVKMLCSSCSFQGAVVSRQIQFNEKSGLLPHIQEVGKWVRKAEISTLIEICAIIGSRMRGGTEMNIKQTIPERLKDLRTECGLTLEQLSEAQAFPAPPSANMRQTILRTSARSALRR